MPITFDLSIVNQRLPVVDWKRFNAEDFPGIPEVLIGELLEDLHPASLIVQHMSYVLDRSDSHASYQIGTSLALLAMCVPQFLVFAPEDLRANIYVCLVGPARKAHKTHAINMARPLVDQIPSASTFVPGKTRLIPEQGSMQQLQDEVIRNPQCLLTIPELGSLLAESGSLNYMRSLRDRLTELYDCSPVQRPTVGKQKAGAMPVQRDPRLSVLAAGTLSHFAAHTSIPDWTTGFLARFLFLYANPERIWDFGHTGDPEKVAYLQTGFAQLAELRGISSCDFSKDATDLWLTWRRSLDNLNKLPIASEPPVNAAEILAKKVAMLVGFDRMLAEARSTDHPLDQSTFADWEIGVEDTRAALRIVNLHIMSALTITNDIADSIDATLMRRILAMCNPITPTPVSTILRTLEIRQSLAQQLIMTLIARGQLSAAGMEGHDTYLRVLDTPHAESTESNVLDMRGRVIEIANAPLPDLPISDEDHPFEGAEDSPLAIPPSRVTLGDPEDIP